MASKAVTTAAGRELSRPGKRESLKSFAERVRYARVECGLSQLEFARAISNTAKTKTTKSIVSQWENGHVKMPQHATVVAIGAVTLFAVEWLTLGTGPERANVKGKATNGHAPSLAVLIRKAVCIAAMVQKTPETIADAAVQVFGALVDAPDTPDAALKRIATLATARKK